MSSGIILCTLGCCPGCKNCLGMAIGCHRKKCRCGNPDQCPECNMTQPEDGHREWCSIGDAEEQALANLMAAVGRATTATSDRPTTNPETKEQS